MYTTSSFPPCCHSRKIFENINQNMNSLRWQQLRVLEWNISSFFLLIILAFRAVSSRNWGEVEATQSDLQSLREFKQELVDPKGFLKSWNGSDDDACSGRWIGIKCVRGRITVIQLPWRSLGGKISEKIIRFRSLRKLSLHNNFIAGSIPLGLGLLPHLRGVQLFNNRFTGRIPPSLGSSSSLLSVDLSSNLLTGTIPYDLANSTKLLKLNLSFNSLSGSIPVFFRSSLVSLDLQHNNFSGKIPNSGEEMEIKHKSFKIVHLNLAHNSFSGTIPPYFCIFSDLRTLCLCNNAINGSLPSCISSLSSLVLMNLTKNQLSGHIPATIGNMKNIALLDISHNKLSGKIPDSISNLVNLSLFNVSYNNLSGSVPKSLSHKFNSSSFIGNLQLCGYDGSFPCSRSPLQSTLAPTPKMIISDSRRKISIRDVILIAVACLLIVLLLLCIVFFCWMRVRTAASKSSHSKFSVPLVAKGGKSHGLVVREDESGGGAGGKLVHFSGPDVFTADDLLCATAEVIGKSTYGTVYKAMLENGNQVAVKRLREKTTKNDKEFETEINFIGKIQHRNLLSLRAYYVGPKGEKLLVHDYMPKGSLATFLHSRGPDTVRDWPTRKKIAKGIAEGLLHLHSEENVIHGNLTSSNVLIDEHADPKIADFAMSRLMLPAANANVIATAAALGFRAPELSKLKKANTKTDVYSFGVVMLEMLTGRSPCEEINGVDLPQWVTSTVKEDWTNEVFDLELIKDINSIGDELFRILKMGMLCVDPTAASRPDASQIVEQLQDIRSDGAGSSIN